MERLLAYPATLPLVHVDHSHRAPSVRTGKCLDRRDPNSIVREHECYADIHGRYSVNRVSIMYTVAGIACNSSKPTVGNVETRRVLDQLVEHAKNNTSITSSGSETLAIGFKPRDSAKPFKTIALVERLGSGYSFSVDYKHPDHNTMGADPAPVVPLVTAYLDEYADDEDGPLFVIQDPATPP